MEGLDHILAALQREGDPTSVALPRRPGMLVYILRRLFASALLIVALLTLLFFLLRLAGDPLAMYASPNFDPSLAEQLRHRFGLDAPLHVQYLRWLEAFLVKWDFGLSFSSQRPVADLLRAALPNTVLLGGLALVFRIGLGVVLGVVSAVRRGGIVDRFLSLSALVFYSLPPFCL